MNCPAARLLITIDLDDTLWPCEPVIASAERACYEWLRANCSLVALAHDVAALREHRRDLMRRRPEIAHDITAVRVESLRLLLDGYGYPAELAEQAVAVFLEARHRVTPYPEVAPALEALGRDHLLVSVTNGNANVERTPLNGYFRLSLSAAAVGAAKPAPQMFRAALERFGIAPECAIHLGDDPHLDVEPARRLGMRAVWMNRSQADWPADLAPPEATVSDLEEFRRWLASVGAQNAGEVSA